MNTIDMLEKEQKTLKEVNELAKEIEANIAEIKKDIEKLSEGGE